MAIFRKSRMGMTPSLSTTPTSDSRSITTSDEIRSRIEFASSIHCSLNPKHLPLWPPGQPFLFYIDPHVGLDCIVDASGGATYLPRTEETPQSHRFHYTWMTTEEYRSRYGWLAFACNAGTQLMIPVTAPRQDGKAVSGLLDNNPCRPTIHLTEDRGFQLPEEVVDAGTVCLTGVIHETASEPWIWLHHLQEEDHTLPWPEETGGTETGARIVNRCRVFAETKGRYFEEADEELHNLIEPERVRQRTEMVVAMQAVIDLVYGQ
ncbi:MAG: hypothetical protein V9H25_13765 [Candidatus Competibacter sp.]